MCDCISAKVAVVPALAMIAAFGLIRDAGAVPSFARQTGQECPACHVSWPELTPYGRYFKLTGYTIGKGFVSSEGFNYAPLAVMGQVSISHIQNNSMVDPDSGDSVPVMQRQDGIVFSGGSLFFATKLSDYVGAFVQWTYDNLATITNGTLGGHSAMDNTDIRAAYKYSPAGVAEPEWVFGLTLNNNPTVQDPWNSTPAWGYPYTTALALLGSIAFLVEAIREDPTNSYLTLIALTCSYPLYRALKLVSRAAPTDVV